MNPTNIIDYSKFKIEVYSPDGEFIGDAKINKENIFYYPNLLTGQEYNIVFSYKGFFLLTLAFTSQSNGKVSYLNPAHVIFNNEVLKSSQRFLNALNETLKFNDFIDKNLQYWEKILMENAVMTKRYHKEIKIPAKRVIKFKAGNELATKVK